MGCRQISTQISVSPPVWETGGARNGGQAAKATAPQAVISSARPPKAGMGPREGRCARKLSRPLPAYPLKRARPSR